MAIGSWMDLRRHKMQRLMGIDVSMNARTAFDQRFLSIGRRPDAARVMRAADLLLQLSDQGFKVMVHCYHGRDRSPFLVMVYLSKKLGIGYAEAFEMVRQRRPRAKFHKEWVETLEKDV